MKLEGSLDAFGLSDVFHLLQATEKTGGLWLRREGTQAVVHLNAGAIVAATLDPARMSLLRRLVMTGAVDEDAIADAATHAADQGTGLVASLQVLNLVDADVLSAVAEALIVDVVFDLLRWPDGDFSFAADELPADDVGLRLGTAAAVSLARARFERWENAATAVPSPDSVPTICDVVDDEKLVVSAADWSVLGLIDGRRSVQEIVDLRGLGAFDVVTVVADLVERDLVHVTAPGDQAPLDARLRRLELMSLLDAAAASVEESDEPAADPVAKSLPEPAPASSSPRRESPVVPERPEPFQHQRRPDHPEPVPARVGQGARSDNTTIMGANAVAMDPLMDQHVATLESAPVPAKGEHGEPVTGDEDPLFNRSLVLRLIAGVRGL